MALTQNASVEYEANQAAFPFEAMTQDPVDSRVYNASVSPFSRASGAAPVIVPYGIDTGGAIIPESGGTDDQVDVGAAVVRMAGAAGADQDGKVQVAGATLTVARPSTQDYLITSITVDNTGTLAMVLGTEGAAFDTTRGAAGGPPYIPVDSIEIGQVRYMSQTSAPVAAGEISQVDGLSAERWNFPIFTPNYREGSITFGADLAAIHTGDVPKLVYVRGATPIFVEKTRSRNWAAAEETHSVSSEPYYDGPVVAISASVNQASFETVFEDGHTDALLGLVGQILWFRFKQDKYASAGQLVNGVVAVDRDYTHGQDPTGTVTISASEKSADFA